MGSISTGNGAWRPIWWPMQVNACQILRAQQIDGPARPFDLPHLGVAGSHPVDDFSELFAPHHLLLAPFGPYQVYLPGWVFLVLNGTLVAALLGAWVTRILAIPGVNDWLRKYRILRWFTPEDVRQQSREK